MDRKNLDIGANLFVGNLDPEVDEKLLYDTFTAFGVIVQPPNVGFSLPASSPPPPLLTSFFCRVDWKGCHHWRFKGIWVCQF